MKVNESRKTVVERATAKYEIVAEMTKVMDRRNVEVSAMAVGKGNPTIVHQNVEVSVGSHSTAIAIEIQGKKLSAAVVQLSFHASQAKKQGLNRPSRY